MAVAHVLVIDVGNEVRSAMSAVDMDSNASFLTGTSIGLTIGTVDAAGVDVHVANEQAFVSAAAMTPEELMSAWAEKIGAVTGGVAGAHAWMSQNSDDEYIMHVEANIPAHTVTLTLPTFVPGV